VAAATREVRRGDRLVTLEPKVFDLLLYLVENRTRVVGKDELLEALWPGVVVAETSLSRCVMKARQALGDDGGAQRMIRTVHGRGYQFVAEPVEEAPGLSPHDTDAVQAAPPETPSRPGRPSLVVLPFTNISGESVQDYLADGLTQDITTELSRNGWMFLISRNSAFTYRNNPVETRPGRAEHGVG